MKFTMHCFECDPKGKKFLKVNIKATNEGIYDAECPNGHKYKFDIACNPFQVIFENGIYALCDKYYIEAFSSFASAYERFMEFFVQVVTISNGVDLDKFKTNLGKNMNRAERLLGAYAMGYMVAFNEQPKVMTNSLNKLRNDVVHNGYIPEKKDCIKYGNALLKIITPTIKRLREDSKYKGEVIRAANDSINPESYKQGASVFHPWPMIGTNRKLDGDSDLTIESLLEYANRVTEMQSNL